MMNLKCILLKCLLFVWNFKTSLSQSSCSSERLSFGSPSQGSCVSDWSRGETKVYPDDFEGILNSVSIYVCPTSDKRVIISNGIPDHDLEMSNDNEPCEINWVVEIPLNPSLENSKTEIAPRGIIAMALNGVPTYGPMESSDENAVETATGQVGGAGYWYGHADGQNRWHVHSPNMGEEFVSSTELLGYAMDGYPMYGPVDDDSVLDACNGVEDGNGNYQYHVRTLDQVDQSLEYCNGSSAETNWNYVLGCYTGSVDSSGVYDSSTYSLPSDCVEDDGSPTASPTSSPTATSTSSPTVTSTSSPTASPNSSPSTCVDSELRFLVNSRSRACTWVAANNTEKRCAKAGGAVAGHCPFTCGVCDTEKCNDATKRFELKKNGNLKSCTWVARTKTEERCAMEGISLTCRATCDNTMCSA